MALSTKIKRCEAKKEQATLPASLGPKPVAEERVAGSPKEPYPTHHRVGRSTRQPSQAGPPLQQPRPAQTSALTQRHNPTMLAAMASWASAPAKAGQSTAGLAHHTQREVSRHANCCEAPAARRSAVWPCLGTAWHSSRRPAYVLPSTLVAKSWSHSRRGPRRGCRPASTAAGEVLTRGMRRALRAAARPTGSPRDSADAAAACCAG